MSAISLSDESLLDFPGTRRIFATLLVFASGLLCPCGSSTCLAQTPKDAPSGTEAAGANGIRNSDNSPNESTAVPSAESTAESAAREKAKQALAPLFDQLIKAHSTRATVVLSADTIIDGAVIGRESSTYQIASQTPDRYTVYLKNENQKTRIYSNSKNTTIALSPTAYTMLPLPIPMLQAVYALPLPMGPYPEPVLALTLASVDPSVTLVEGMKSLKLADRNKFRGETPAIHFVGIQEDAVKWDLWISQGDEPKPLRLLVDLTEMLRINGGAELPATYQYLLRFDFASWRMNHPNSPSLFEYVPAKTAQKFDSIDAYLNQKQPTSSDDAKVPSESPTETPESRD